MHFRVDLRLLFGMSLKHTTESMAGMRVKEVAMADVRFKLKGHNLCACAHRSHYYATASEHLTLL